MDAYRLRVCIAFMFVMMPVCAAAQLEVGVLGGLNFSDAKIEDNLGNKIDVTGRTVYGAGALARYRLNKNLSLGADLLYLRKAIAARNEQDLVFDVRADYIEIPLYLKYAFGDGVRPYLILGPSAGFLLNSEVEIDLAGLTFTGDFSTVLEKFDFGVMIGAGLDIPLGRGNLMIRGSYSYGLYDVLKGGTVELKAGQTLRQDATIDEGDNLFTRGIQLMAGYTLPLSL